MTTQTVTIRECRANGQVWETRHKGTPEEALARALRKHWGPSAFLQLDSGLNRGGRLGEARIYGQVFRSVGQQGNSATGRVSVDVGAIR